MILQVSDTMAVLTSEVVRAARALLRWDQRNLAEASSISLPTIKRLEFKPGPLEAHTSTVAALITRLRKSRHRIHRRKRRRPRCAPAQAPAPKTPQGTEMNLKG